MKLSIIKRVIFSLLPAIILFSSIEVILRIAGFYFSTTPLLIGMPEIVVNANNSGKLDKINGFNARFRKDKWLLWTLKPDGKRVNSNGFRGKEIDIVKSRDTIRIACMGDSCTMIGQISYPEYLRGRLHKKMSNYNIEVINASCGSYSSLQGLRLLKLRVIDFKPDYISIFFGWNDHWLSKDKPDKDYAVQSELTIAIKNFMNRFRIYQFFVKQILLLRGKLDEHGHMVYKIQPRVSLSDYEDNLKQMVEVCREINSKPILITAPTNLDETKESLRILCRYGIFDDPHMFNRVHSRYNDVVKKVARSNKTLILDLEDILNKMADIDTYFMRDGIHFTKKGRIFIARLMSKMISDDFLKEPK